MKQIVKKTCESLRNNSEEWRERWVNNCPQLVHKTGLVLHYSDRPFLKLKNSFCKITVKEFPKVKRAISDYQENMRQVKRKRLLEMDL